MNEMSKYTVLAEVGQVRSMPPYLGTLVVGVT